MSSTSRIPSYTEVYTTSPTAAGLPVLEVVKRLEEEKLITKDDRTALKDGLYSIDVSRREEIVRALCEVELSMNSKFSIRRLKAIIHQNGSGEVSSKHQHKPGATLKSSDTDSGHASSQANQTQTLKAEARPSKYRMKQRTQEAPDSISPGSSGYTTYSPVNNNMHEGPVSSYVPSSSGAHGSSGPLRLFPSPTLVQSAREKTTSALPASNSAVPQTAAAPGTAEPPVIHYTNNNVRMGSPKTSRSREGTASPQRLPATYTPSSSSHTAQSTPLLSSGTQQSHYPQHNSQHQSHSSGHNSYSTSATSQLPQHAPNSGRGQRPSPYRSHPDGHSLNTTSATSHYGHNTVTHGTGHIGNNNTDEEDPDGVSTINAINQVVGNQPVYSGPDCFHNVLSKIAARLREFCAKYDEATRGKRRLAVLVGGGSFNPLTRMHLRTYFLAKQCLEAKYGYVVLGSLLSPAHGATVRERYRTNPSEIIPSPHRLAVAQLLVQNSKLLSVDPWEITRRRAMDYLSLLEHVAAIIKDQLEGVDVKVLYVCKPNMVPKLSPQALRESNFGVVTVCRTHESDVLRNALTAKWNGAITVVEDTAILDASMDVITSRKVRDKMKLGHSVEQLVGDKINDYVQIHHLGAKMNGTEKWEQEEKVLPSLASRPAVPTLTSQFNKLMLQQQLQQMQLQQGSVASNMTGATGEYSPDRLLLPINELTTMNMSAHNSAYTHQTSSSTHHPHIQHPVGKIGTGQSKHSSASGHSSHSGAYMPSWMAEPDV